MKNILKKATQYNVSEFKAKALKLFDETFKKGQEYIIAKKGQPIAKVIPFQPKTESHRGTLKGFARLKTDITNLTFADDWELTS